MKSRAPRAPKEPAPQPRGRTRSTLSRADRALIARLEKKGLLISGPDAGKPLDPDDEILQPGPACPGIVDEFIAMRREGP